MTSVFSADSPTKTAAALIVEPSIADAVFLVTTLSALGFSVTVSDRFQEAKARLRVPPALLVTEIRLGEYNGLHLVLRGKSARVEMAAVVTSRVTDSVLQAEAERMGATFVLKPITLEELRAAICRTVLRTPEAPPIRPPFERRRTDRRAAAAPHHQERRLATRRVEVTKLIQEALSE
jgi:DNA-binding response OmpR family regulator